MNSIFAKALYELEKHDDLCLVTIVADDGSAPRGSGSMMLVGKEGRLVGTIGGGPSEFIAEKLAKEFIEKKSSGSHEFRLNTNDVEDIGAVCGGNIDVYFQYIPGDSVLWTELARGVMGQIESRRGGWFIQSLKGGSPALVSETGDILAGAKPDSDAVLYTTGNVNADGYYSMPLPVGERAIIFGGGHIARSLVPILKTVGFRVTVVDNRPEYSKAEDFPDAETVMTGDYTRIDQYISVQPDDYIVVMTNGHSHDYEVQEQMLRHEIAYIGVVGSRSKIAYVNKRLMDAGISEERCRFVHTPVGVAIKAVTPAEIAVSIAGEKISLRADRTHDKATKSCPVE